MPEVPPPPPKKGKGPSQTQEEKTAESTTSGDVYTGLAVRTKGRNVWSVRLTKSVKSIPGHLLEHYELWLKSLQFESWTSERERYAWGLA
ncbi:hypothetical protein R1flu_014134 [Riccia fluitans]|uniref:Uncharacterized protein n=1 Tax=Riccia fluitans TaxID=41844 RepID=A0ABD1YF87_9MARC